MRSHDESVKCNRQKGSVVLMFVSMILLALLLMSLAAYRNHHFQTQQAHNRILQQQLYWQAQGGLACFMTLHRQQPIIEVSDLNTSSCFPAQISLVKLSDEPLIYDVISLSQTIEEGDLSIEITNTIKQVDAGAVAGLSFEWMEGRWRDF